MPLKNEKLPEMDLGALIKGLKDTGIEFIIVGGVAAVAYGSKSSGSGTQGDTYRRQKPGFIRFAG